MPTNAPRKPSSRAADPERKKSSVGASNPDASAWDVEKPYYGPPEEGQPRAGSAGDDERRRRVPERRPKARQQGQTR